MEWLAVALVGGLVGLDATSFPQAMVSRPLIAATLTGALFGQPTAGVVLGFIMEAFSLVILPIGAARYPESGTASVAAVTGYIAAAPPALDAGYLVLAVAFALVWERLTGESVVQLRRANGRILTRGGAIGARQLERRHLAAMALDFLRAAVLSVGGGLVAFGLLRLLGPAWGVEAGVAVPVMAVLLAAMLGAVLSLFGGWKARRLALLLGVAAGVAIAVAS